MSALYSLYDCVSRRYVFFGEFDHRRSAIECFLKIDSSPLTYNFSSDFFLVEIGYYDSESGQVVAHEKPITIARGSTAANFKEENDFSSLEIRQNYDSDCKDGSQVKKRINLGTKCRWFYAVILTLLLAAIAISLCACTSPFINIERFESNASVL